MTGRRDLGPATEDRTGWPSEWWEITAIRVRPLPTAGAGDPLGAPLGGPLGLTAVVPVRAGAAVGAQTNFVTQHELTDVRVVDVDASRFALPGGFAETPWSGDECGGRSCRRGRRGSPGGAG